MTRIADRVVATLTDHLDRKRSSRRSFLVKTAVNEKITGHRTPQKDVCPAGKAV